MSYIDTCKAFVSEMDGNELGQITPNQAPSSGNGYSFRSLGRMCVPTQVSFMNRLNYVGIKTSNYNKGECESRLPSDVATAQFLIRENPRFRSLISPYMALVRITETNEALGIITEDASQDGQKAVNSIRTSLAVQRMLAATLGMEDRPQDAISDDESLSFKVGDKELLLDFSPSPFKQSALGRSDKYREAFSESVSSIPDLTVYVPQGSNLVRSLMPNHKLTA